MATENYVLVYADGSTFSNETGKRWNKVVLHTHTTLQKFNPPAALPRVWSFSFHTLSSCLLTQQAAAASPTGIDQGISTAGSAHLISLVSSKPFLEAVYWQETRGSKQIDGDRKTIKRKTRRDRERDGDLTDVDISRTTLLLLQQS